MDVFGINMTADGSGFVSPTQTTGRKNHPWCWTWQSSPWPALDRRLEGIYCLGMPTKEGFLRKNGAPAVASIK